MADRLKVTLVKSPIGCVPKHKKTVEALVEREKVNPALITDNATIEDIMVMIIKEDEK